MSMMCRLGGHEAGPREVYNSGYYFSRCRRCDADMIRGGGSWEMVPDGHQVVWKAGRHSHSVEPDYDHALPVLHPAANLPMVRPAFSSWSRQLARRRTKPARPEAAATAATLETEEPPYPRLLVLAAILGAGLQLLFAVGSRRGFA
jgi:hypothetical protein